MAMIFSRLQLSSLLVAGGMVVSVHFLASSLETLIFGNVIQTAGAGGDDGDNATSLMLAVGPDSRACAVAKRRALLAAPELLSLAPWPLDDHAPAECSTGPQDSVAALDEPLPAAVEMTDASPAAALADAVLAELAVTEKPIAKKAPGETARTLDAGNVLGQQLAALDTAALDEVRGGFQLEGSSLTFSIGIERAVYINGNLVATNVLNLKELQSSAGGTSVAAASPAAPAGALVVQNGPAGSNYVAPQVAQNPTATVIQNSLDGQKIQAVTTINASVNSLQTVRAMSVANAIQYGIVSSLRR
jgi:hypothetical protein